MIWRSSILGNSTHEGPTSRSAASGLRRDVLFGPSATVVRTRDVGVEAVHGAESPGASLAIAGRDAAKVVNRAEGDGLFAGAAVLPGGFRGFHRERYARGLGCVNEHRFEAALEDRPPSRTNGADWCEYATIKPISTGSNADVVVLACGS